MQSIRPSVEPVPILCSPAYAKSARDGGRHWVRRPSGVGAGAGRKGAHIPETGHGKCCRNRDAGCCRGTEEHRHWSWGDRSLPRDEGACLDLQAELGVLHAAAGILCTCAVVGFWVVDATEASTVDARGRKHTHTHKHLKAKQARPGCRKPSTQRWEAPKPFPQPHPGGKNRNKGKSDLLSIRKNNNKKVI